MTKTEFTKIIKAAQKRMNDGIEKLKAEFSKIEEAAKVLYQAGGGELETSGAGDEPKTVKKRGKKGESVEPQIDGFMAEHIETKGVGAMFDINDVLKAVPAINRASTSKALTRMAQAGKIRIISAGSGRKPSVYAPVSQPEAPSLTD